MTIVQILIKSTTCK